MDKDLSIAIIGAGFAGIGMAIQLKKAGFTNFTIYEKKDAIGGTWRDSVYPGCRCDVPAHLYSYSFSPKANWNSVFATADEIRDYLAELVTKWQLETQLALGCPIETATYDENSCTWELVEADGNTVNAHIVIAATGFFVKEKYPDIPGIETFSGKTMHTASWDESYDLREKGVAVIGTGASGIQIIPTIANIVDELFVFQRSAPWVLPKFDRPYSRFKKFTFKHIPLSRRLHRFAHYFQGESYAPMIISKSKRLKAKAENFALYRMKSEVSDEAIQNKLSPNYQLGCKRVLLSDDYWQAYEETHVHLITEDIECINKDGIVFNNQQLKLDTIIFATGYELSTHHLPIQVIGRNGQSMRQQWEDGAKAYKGMTVSGFPNWFYLMGPNTGPGHTSVLVYTEAQINYIVKALKKIVKNNIKSIEVKKDKLERYNKKLQNRMRHTSWKEGGCNSWYQDRDGSIHTLYPGLATEYLLKTKFFRLSDYKVDTE